MKQIDIAIKRLQEKMKNMKCAGCRKKIQKRIEELQNKYGDTSA